MWLTDPASPARLEAQTHTHMHKHILTFAALAACVAPCFAAAGWITDDMAAARQQAQEQKKGIIIDFTGSDWCMPCRNLKATVLDNPEFMEKASQHFVLLELDYPRGKQQSDEVKKQNAELSELYQIQGYPTVVFADGAGLPLEAFIGGLPLEEVLKKLASAEMKLDGAQKAAHVFSKAASDDERVDALLNQLKLAPKEYLHARIYDGTRNAIMELDKEDRTGMRAAAKARAEADAQTEAIITWLKGQNIKRDTPPDKLIELVRSYPDKDKLQPEARQNLMMFEMNFHYDAKTALGLAEEIIALGADTPAGVKAQEIRDSIRQQLEDYEKRQQQKKK